MFCKCHSIFSFKQNLRWKWNKYRLLQNVSLSLILSLNSLKLPWLTSVKAPAKWDSQFCSVQPGITTATSSHQQPPAAHTNSHQLPATNTDSDYTQDLYQSEEEDFLSYNFFIQFNTDPSYHQITQYFFSLVVHTINITLHYSFKFCSKYYICKIIYCTHCNTVY